MAQSNRNRLWRRYQDQKYIARRIRMINYLWYPNDKIRLQLLKDCKTCAFRLRCLVDEGPYYGSYKRKCAKKIEWLQPHRYGKFNLKCTCDRCTADKKYYRGKGSKKLEYQDLQRRLNDL